MTHYYQAISALILLAETVRICTFSLVSATAVLVLNHHHFQRTHVFGGPVVILDPGLHQDSKKTQHTSDQCEARSIESIWEWVPFTHLQSIWYWISQLIQLLPNTILSLMTPSLWSSPMVNLMTLLPGSTFFFVVMSCMQPTRDAIRLGIFNSFEGMGIYERPTFSSHFYR